MRHIFTKIYGESDDLIIFDGEIVDEYDCSDTTEEINIELSDGTKGTLRYDHKWKVDIFNEGELFKKVIPSVSDGEEHEGEAIGCSPYSDVLILKEGIEWIKINEKIYE